MDEAEKIAAKYTADNGCAEEISALVARERDAAAEAMRGNILDKLHPWKEMEVIRRDILALPLPDAAPEPQALRVPEGWKLVPLVPTEAMIEAGWIDKEDVDPDDIYAAMLDAAPSPPSDGGKG